ncbi:pyridoxamine 5'-phosphate oxidase [Actinoalloteichus sp. AHMU CJ021]|uniref:pyridoxamine 5'-phosphate oxidase family protein n=1 Tax=Actinoalloteichus sp. AHMU CJ021 TaxID=2072503 RepID=UPI000CA01A7F|nr:pyridoxamine 5'-phosphate oxidase [Actinoalloteichus sp. AHMU CJ021]
METDIPADDAADLVSWEEGGGPPSRTEPLFGPSDASPFDAQAPLTPWSEAERRLAAASTVWLVTTRPDGRPHAVPVFAVWVDGALFVTLRPGSRKGRNLAVNPQVSVIVSSDELELVLEGRAERVREVRGLRRVGDALAGRFGWRLAVADDGVVTDPDLPGEPEYGIYGVVPRVSFGFAEVSATRWSW